MPSFLDFLVLRDVLMKAYFFYDEIINAFLCDVDISLDKISKIESFGIVILI
jgi:hypothetical protein